MKYQVTFTVSTPSNETGMYGDKRNYVTTIIGYTKTAKAGWILAQQYADDNNHPKQHAWNDPITYSYDVSKVEK